VLHRRQAPFRYEETGGKHLFWRRRVDVVETDAKVQRQTLREAPLILRVERDIPQRFTERPRRVVERELIRHPVVESIGNAETIQVLVLRVARRASLARAADVRADLHAVRPGDVRDRNAFLILATWNRARRSRSTVTQVQTLIGDSQVLFASLVRPTQIAGARVVLIEVLSRDARFDENSTARRTRPRE